MSQGGVSVGAMSHKCERNESEWSKCGRKKRVCVNRNNIDALASDIGKPDFHHHLQHFLQDQFELDATSSPFYIPNKVYVYSSAITSFYTPSDICGTGGMRCECIHAVTSWRYGKP